MPSSEPARKHADGVAFILDQIRKHPGEVTIIAIGPEGNLAAAIQRDAATFHKVKRVVLMGGSVYRGYGDEHRPPDPEWNIDRDPASAKALFTSGVPIFMMPLDSTQVHLPHAGPGKNLCVRIAADRSADPALPPVGGAYGEPCRRPHFVRPGGGDLRRSSGTLPGQAAADRDRRQGVHQAGRWRTQRPGLPAIGRKGLLDLLLSRVAK